MTGIELIEELKKQPEDAIVFVSELGTDCLMCEVISVEREDTIARGLRNTYNVKGVWLRIKV